VTNHSRYPATVFWSSEDEGFIAIAADLPGCSAFGETREEALRELEPAISAWIDAACAAGNPVPAPSTPAAEPDVSGKFLLRMPKSLHRHLVHEAKREGVSLNQHINLLLVQNSTLFDARTALSLSIFGVGGASAIPLVLQVPSVTVPSTSSQPLIVRNLEPYQSIGWRGRQHAVS